MQMWNLNEAAIDSLLEMPETGMGFQLVEAVVLGATRPLLVFNAEHAIDLSAINLQPGDDPATVLTNGFHVVNEINSSPPTLLFAAPSPHSFRLLGSRIAPSGISPGPTASAPIQVALPSSLVKPVVLPSNRTFFRFSAFHPDKRVDPLTGSFLSGTYASPESEIPFVPTGFVAVGRFALPNNLPASNRYEIEAPVGTQVDFGTVAPAFGQAGGGVEALFQNAVTNAQIPPTPVTRLPDE